MLALNGTIGSKLVLTFVREDILEVSQERINGRKAYLAVDSRRVKKGDRCLVTIVDETPDHSMYFVFVDEIIERGDGHSSLLEKVLTEVEIGSRRGEASYEQKVIARLRTLCNGGAGDATMLEVLLDILESYSVDVPHRRAELKYGHFCIVIARLIQSLFADDAEKRVDAYRRAAQYCSAKSGGRGWAESFRAVAATLKAN